jgi:peptide/nickel transport system substrate-binding protein
MGEPVEEFQVMTMTAVEDPRRFEISRLAVDAWEDLGIPAELWPVASPVMVEQAWEGKSYQVYFIHHDPNPDRMEPDTWLYTYYHSSNVGPSGSNLSGYQNPEFDALAEAQRSEPDIAKRKELVDKAQEWLYNAQPFHPFANLHLAGVYNLRLLTRWLSPILRTLTGSASCMTSWVGSLQMGRPNRGLLNP